MVCRAEVKQRKNKKMKKLMMAAAVVIAAPECKLSIVQNVIRRLSLSGYSDIVLMFPCLPEK